MTDTATLDVEQIKKLLPHRPPMLFVEKLADIVPYESATGYKAVTINEPVVMGHFPGRAVIGPGDEIRPFCHVGSRVRLKEGVRLRSHGSLAGITHVGPHCDLYPGVALGGEGQIRGNDFTEGRLEIGADCVLREMVSM